MKRILSYGLLGLLTFLLSLLLLAPATLVANRVGERLPGFTAQMIEGTVTAGSMQGLRWRGSRIERMRWDWRPLALLAGWLEFELDVDDPEAKLTGSAAVGWNQQWRFQNLAGRLPLARLGALIGQPKLPLQGTVEFKLRDLYLNPAGRPQAAHGVVDLLNLRAVLGQPLNLGDFRVQLTTADPEGIQGTIQDNGGPLVLEGTFTLLPDSRYRFNGWAMVRDAGNRALLQAMRLLGPSGDDGRWVLGFSGVLAL